jgi:sugar phosphate permease
MGVSEACYIPAALAIISDYHRGPTRSLATGLHMSGLYAGAALGGLGGVMAQHLKWQSAFNLFGAIGVVYSIVLIFALKDAAKEDELSLTNTGLVRWQRHWHTVNRQAGKPALQEKINPAAAFGYFFQSVSFWALLTYFALLSVAYWAIYGWLPTYMAEQFKLGQGAAGMSATAYIQIASLTGVLIGGAWADWWCRSNIRARLYVPLLGFCLAGPALYMSSTTGALALAITGLIVFGLARGFADANNMPILCQITPARYRATGYGVLNFLGCVMGGVMTYVAGALKDANVGLEKVFQFCAGGVVVAVLLLLLVKPKKELEQV